MVRSVAVLAAIVALAATSGAGAATAYLSLGGGAEIVPGAAPHGGPSLRVPNGDLLIRDVQGYPQLDIAAGNARERSRVALCWDLNCDTAFFNGRKGVLVTVGRDTTRFFGKRPRWCPDPRRPHRCKRLRVGRRWVR